MLQLNELEKLRADRHKAGLISRSLIEKGNWHSDARKCVLAKLTESEGNCSEWEGHSKKEGDNYEEGEDEERKEVVDDNEECNERDEQ